MLTAMLGRNPGSNLDLGCPPPGGAGIRLLFPGSTGASLVPREEADPPLG